MHVVANLKPFSVTNNSIEMQRTVVRNVGNNSSAQANRSGRLHLNAAHLKWNWLKLVLGESWHGSWSWWIKWDFLWSPSTENSIWPDINYECPQLSTPTVRWNSLLRSDIKNRVDTFQQKMHLMLYEFPCILVYLMKAYMNQASNACLKIKRNHLLAA